MNAETAFAKNSHAFYPLCNCIAAALATPIAAANVIHGTTIVLILVASAQIQEQQFRKSCYWKL